jgi:hypothetical protein
MVSQCEKNAAVRRWLAMILSPAAQGHFFEIWMP